MRLGVGLQFETALGHRFAQAHGGHHVLQRLARAHMHVHVAGGHQRHTGELRGAFELVLPQVVVQAVQQFQGDPEAVGEYAFQTRGVSAQGLERQQPRRHQQHLATFERREIAAVQGHVVLALGRLAARGRDELAQVAPALQVVRQHDQRELRVGRQSSRNRVHFSPVIAGLTRNPWMPDQFRHDKVNGSRLIRVRLVWQGRLFAVAGIGRGCVPHPELRAQQQLQPEFPGLRMRPHHPGHRTLVGDGQRCVAQRGRARHQFFRQRGAALEAETGEAMQLGIGRQIGFHGIVRCQLSAIETA